MSDIGEDLSIGRSYGIWGRLSVRLRYTSLRNVSSSGMRFSSFKDLIKSPLVVYASALNSINYNTNMLRPPLTGTAGFSTNPCLTFDSVRISSSWLGCGGKYPCRPTEKSEQQRTVIKKDKYRGQRHWMFWAAIPEVVVCRFREVCRRRSDRYSTLMILCILHVLLSWCKFHEHKTCSPSS